MNPTTEITIAAAGAELPSQGEPPEWIHLLATGTITLADGRGPFKIDPDAVIAATRKLFGDRDLPIDYDHASVGGGKAAPAAGWVTALEAREDGVWGRVRWTKAAAQKIADLEYRYLSPTFVAVKKTGRVLRLTGAGLVINPAMTLTAIAASQGHDMDLSEICAALGLAEDADLAAVTAGAKTLADGVAAIASALGHEGETDTAKLVTAAKGLAAAKPDPAKFVPIEQVAEINARLAKVEADRAGEVAETKVTAAIQAGKLAPSMKGWGLELCKSSAKAFDDYVANAPAIIQPGAAGVANGKAPGLDDPLDATERSVCRQMGVGEEAFKKARAERLATEGEAA